VDRAALDALATTDSTLLRSMCDVADRSQVAAMFDDALRALDGLDVLVNNAGIAGPTAKCEDIPSEAWERTLAVNITGQFHCAQLAIPHLRRSGNASIVNLSSAAGRFGFPLRTPYSASKWAVIGFTKSLSIELGGDGIRVNAILPGAVDGPRIQAVIAAKAKVLGKPVEEMTRAYTSQAALGRMVTSRDVANMVLFAASDLARNVTGQELVVDGLTQALN
jgi:NAD(P)-dependent dehydrogenase (short-subunit alcohol dehydrogenase family)